MPQPSGRRQRAPDDWPGRHPRRHNENAGGAAAAPYCPATGHLACARRDERLYEGGAVNGSRMRMFTPPLRRLLVHVQPAALLAAALCTSQPALATCPGDLNGDGRVTIDEVITIVQSALRGCPPTPAACPGDFDGDHRVTITEIIAAVNALLFGCPPTSTPTDSPAATATGTATATATAFPSASPTATPTATQTANATSTLGPEVTDTPSPPPTSTPSPIASAASATPTATTTLTPSPTATPTACPYTFADDTLSLATACLFTGPFNANAACPSNLAAFFLSDGHSVAIQFGAQTSSGDALTVTATVTSPTAATLTSYSIGSNAPQALTGTVELRANGDTLIVAPDNAPPFLISTCTLDHYTGTFGQLLSTAAPARIGGAQLQTAQRLALPHAVSGAS